MRRTPHPSGVVPGSAHRAYTASEHRGGRGCPKITGRIHLGDSFRKGRQEMASPPLGARGTLVGCTAKHPRQVLGTLNSSRVRLLTAGSQSSVPWILGADTPQRGARVGSCSHAAPVISRANKTFTGAKVTSKDLQPAPLDVQRLLRLLPSAASLRGAVGRSEAWGLRTAARPERGFVNTTMGQPGLHPRDSSHFQERTEVPGWLA